MLLVSPVLEDIHWEAKFLNVHCHGCKVLISEGCIVTEYPMKDKATSMCKP